MRKTCVPALITLTLCIGSAWSVAAPVGFLRLGDLPGGTYSSEAAAISADGSTVVGLSYSNLGRGVFRWTAETGMVRLPYGSSTQVRDVSADGNVIVGTGLTNDGYRAFRWIASVGEVPMTTPPSIGVFTDAWAVSDDGSVIAGRMLNKNGNSEAVRWSAATGTVGLGDLPGNSSFPGSDFLSEGFGISGDGNLVTGWSNTYSGMEAFQWTQTGGIDGIGDLPGSSFHSGGIDASYDGSVIVGLGRSLSGPEATRWVNGVPHGLGDLPGGPFISQARGVSADGQVVVGYSYTDAGQEAFFWTQDQGMVNLREFLIAQGVPGVSDWELTIAWDISGDGRKITGTGINPAGQTEAWIAIVPEPSTWTLLAAALPMAGLIARKRNRLSLVSFADSAKNVRTSDS
jgi:probable HAF family extracellular repeat protein